jgi:cytoskeleton protein RodZ
MTDLAAAPEDLPAPEAAPPGRLLAARREERGLSLADVAQRLKFAPRQIEALERGDYASLPGITFVRGMIRGYARMLELDPATLLAALAAEPGREVPPAPERIAPPNDAIAFPAGTRRGNRTYMLLSVAAVVVALLVIFEWQFAGLSRLTGESDDKPASVAVTSPPPAAPPADSAPPAASSEPAAVPKPAEAAPPASSPSSAAQQGAALAGAPIPGAGAKPALQPYSAAAPGAATQTAAAPGVAPSAAQTAATAAATGKTGQMSLHFDSDSWVRIKQGDGKVLMAQLNHGGTDQTVEGTPPFDVIIGNAPNVRLTYNNAPVDLRPYFKVDVARLTLN